MYASLELCKCRVFLSVTDLKMLCLGRKAVTELAL